MKLLFDESLSPRLVSLLGDLFPESESALRNGLSRIGDSTDFGIRRSACELTTSRDQMIILER